MEAKAKKKRADAFQLLLSLLISLVAFPPSTLSTCLATLKFYDLSCLPLALSTLLTCLNLSLSVFPGIRNPLLSVFSISVSSGFIFVRATTLRNNGESCRIKGYPVLLLSKRAPGPVRLPSLFFFPLAFPCSRCLPSSPFRFCYNNCFWLVSERFWRYAYTVLFRDINRISIFVKLWSLRLRLQRIRVLTNETSEDGNIRSSWKFRFIRK